jgi:hypothetical protein
MGEGVAPLLPPSLTSYRALDTHCPRLSAIGMDTQKTPHIAAFSFASAKGFTLQ